MGLVAGIIFAVTPGLFSGFAQLFLTAGVSRIQPVAPISSKSPKNATRSRRSG